MLGYCKAPLGLIVADPGAQQSTKICAAAGVPRYTELVYGFVLSRQISCMIFHSHSKENDIELQDYEVLGFLLKFFLTIPPIGHV